MLPPGWVLQGTCRLLPPDEAWVAIVTYVDEMGIVLGDPTEPYTPELWRVGFDNATLTFGKNGIPPIAPDFALDE